MTDPRTETVTVPDGSFDLYLWTPEGRRGPGLLLLQEIFGVGSYIRAVAGRLAGEGYVVGAPDVFWRFAPQWVADHDEAGLTASFEKVQQLDVEQAIVDCAAALEHLGGLDEVEGRPGVLGFCLGGTLAWGVAAQGAPSVCVSYYGSGVPGMRALADSIECPTLLHFGAEDPYIPADDVMALNDLITGRERFMLNVESAGHAFDNHEAPAFYDETAAQAAWAKTMAFVGLHLPTA